MAAGVKHYFKNGTEYKGATRDGNWCISKAGEISWP
jgi:hypothetical protein